MCRSPGSPSKVAGGARTPYDAVEKLEHWFVASGTFHYSNHPPVISPPLVTFVTKTHAGYCQYFAGAMALMLRYLGIPARVAVGFAGGTYDPKRRLWNVTDREAHAWVEVWFKGYGWLPFDPTPAAPWRRPRLTRPGGSAAGWGQLDRVRPRPSRAGPPSRGGRVSRRRSAPRTGSSTGAAGGFRPDPGVRGRGSGERHERSWPVLLLLAVLAGAVGVIVLTKSVFRLGRSIRRNPRGVAASCRQELTSFLVDQRIEAPRSATFGDLGELVRREFGVRPEAFVAAATAARFGPAETRLPRPLPAARAARPPRHRAPQPHAAGASARAVVAPLAHAAGGVVSESTYNLFQRGRRHLRAGMAAQATVSLEKAKRREPDKASIRETLGIAYFRIRRWSEAEAEFRKVLELSPVNDYAHYALGRCLEKQGRNAEANRHYKLASSLQPGSQQYRARIRELD